MTTRGKIILTLLILGVVGLGRLGTDLFPNVSFPFVTITAVYPGAGPQEIESQVVKPIEDAIEYYGAEASEFLRLFYVDLKARKIDKDPKTCLEEMREKHKTIKPLRLAPGHISCHHVTITPSRILLEGPYTTQSNRVIRKYQDLDPALAERFVREEFRERRSL